MWTNIELKNGKYINTPEVNTEVLAILKWCGSGKTLPAIIKHVKEDDVCWRTVDDNSELSYSLDVIKWMYIPKY